MYNVHIVSSEKKRAQFRTPRRLVDRADALATVFGSDRTGILITALREYLREATHDDDLKQEIAAAYYNDEITFGQLADLVGREETANFRALKRQLGGAYADELADL